MENLNFIIKKEKHKWCFFSYEIYKLQPITIFIINQITDIPINIIKQITIHKNLIPLTNNYLAITFGRKQQKAHISFQKKFFYNRSSSQIIQWLEILCHEATHIKQIKYYTILKIGLLPYLLKHIYYYIKNFSHDKSPLEKLPIANQNKFIRFNKFINSTVGNNALINLIQNTELTENEKIKQLDNYFSQFYVSRK